MNKGLLGKISLFSIILLVIIAILISVIPTFSVPTFEISGLSSNNTNYTSSKNFGFQINITDDVCGMQCISNATFETNITTGGALENITKADTTKYTTFTNNTGGIWWINFTQEQTKGAGTYFFKWYANSITGVWNASTPKVFVITKAPTLATIYVNGSTNNQTSTFPNSTINVTAESNISGLYVQIWRNGTLVCNTTSSCVNITQRGAWNNNFTAKILGNENYSDSAPVMLWWNVSQGPTVVTLYLNGSLSNQTSFYPNSTINVTAESNVSGLTVTIWRNDTQIATGTSSVSNIDKWGAWNSNFTALVSGNENYTTSSLVIKWWNISQGAPTVSLYVNGSTNNQTSTFPNSTINVTAESNISGLYVQIWRNGTLVCNTTSSCVNITQRGAWNNNFTAKILIELENYTSTAAVTIWWNVSAGTPDVKTFIEELSTNKTINYSTSVTIRGNSTTTVNPPTFNLYVINTTNSSPAVYFNNTTSSPTISTLLLGNGTYKIVYNTTGNGNYSSAENNTLYLFVNQNSTNPVILTINNGTAYTNQDVRITAGTSITATCSNTYSESGTCYLYRDGVDKSGTETLALTAGTYTYKANITGNANYSNAAGVSYTLTVVSSSSGGGGGSSGGGSTTPSVSIKLAKGNVNFTVTTIASGKSAIASIAKYQDVAIREVNITVSNSVNNIKIAILKLPGLPASVSHEISGKVYHYISIDKTNFTDADINKIYFKFAVNKTWFTENNVDYSNITLYRWSGAWDALPTTKVEEGTDEIFYKAESAGLSYFAIGTNVPQAPPESPITPPSCTESWSCTDWSACVDGTKTRTCTDSNSCGTTVNKPAESGTCLVEEGVVSKPTGLPTESIVITVVAIIAIVAIAAFGNRKKIMPYISKLMKKGKSQYVYKKPAQK